MQSVWVDLTLFSPALEREVVFCYIDYTVYFVLSILRFRPKVLRKTIPILFFMCKIVFPCLSNYKNLTS